MSTRDENCQKVKWQNVLEGSESYRALHSLTNTYFLITGKWLKMLMREKREEREKESAPKSQV